MYDRKRLDQIDALSRQPFRAPLDRWLEHAPTDEDIAAIAKKSPDRWAQGVAVLARLSGYRDQVELEASHTLAGLLARIPAMSDADLVAALTELHRAPVLQLPLASDQPLAIPADAAPDAAADGAGASPAAPTATGPRAACA